MQISQILHFFLIIDHYAFSVWIFAALSILILNITNNIQIVDAVPQPGEVNMYFFYILRNKLEVFLISDIFSRDFLAGVKWATYTEALKWPIMFQD